MSSEVLSCIALDSQNAPSYSWYSSSELDSSKHSLNFESRISASSSYKLQVLEKNGA